MKIALPLLIAAIAFCGFSFWSKLSSPHVSLYEKTLFSSGAPASRTGAPGESNCTSCHSGSVLAGAGINELVLVDGVDTVFNYTPGVIYKVRTNMNLTTSKKGFQATVLNSSNTFVGTITALTNTLKNTGSSREYANHKGTSTSGATPYWEFQWQAPATDQGAVIFYMSTNNTNNNGSDTGDQIYLSQHPFNSTAGIESKTLGDFVNVYFNKDKELIFKINQASEENLEIVMLDMEGRIVPISFYNDKTTNGIQGKIISKNSLINGTYFVHFVIGNNTVSKKVVY